VSIGENVRQIRQEQRYTQTEIARRCGVTPAAISGLEHGDFTPSTSLLARLAKALGVSADALLKEPVPLGEATLPPELDPTELEDWASGADTLDELRPVHRALWLRWRELADYDRVVGGGERALADALEAEEKRMIIEKRMMELSPTPLATIVMRLDEPTQVIYHRDPTDEERAGLRAEYPDAIEVEARQVALAY
jgi:transcriptional regulator with XRE-family HTH domain